MKNVSNNSEKVFIGKGKTLTLLLAIVMLITSISLLAGCKPKPSPTSETMSSEDVSSDPETESRQQDSSEDESAEVSENGSEDESSTDEGSSAAPSSSQVQSSAATSTAASSAVPTVTKAPTPTSAANSKLFTENFESGMDRWTTTEGTWAIVQDGTKALKQSNRDTWEAIVTAGDTGWTDYTFTVKFKLHNGYFGLIGRVKNADNLYLFDLNELGYSVWCKNNGGYNHTLPDITFASVSLPNLAVDQWHTAGIRFSGNQITLFLNGEQLGDPINDNTIGNGKIGFRSSYGTFTVDDITVE